MAGGSKRKALGSSHVVITGRFGWPPFGSLKRGSRPTPTRPAAAGRPLEPLAVRSSRWPSARAARREPGAAGRPLGGLDRGCTRTASGSRRRSNNYFTRLAVAYRPPCGQVVGIFNEINGLEFYLITIMRPSAASTVRISGVSGPGGPASGPGLRSCHHSGIPSR